MKNILLTACILVGLGASVNSQTAVNFNCNDCNGNNHDLFTELDAGKVIVISWVMPCGSCIGPTLTASNIVQSYASSNPGQVFLYVADDYANTNCTAIGSWCTTNGITATTFSNAALDMLDYNTTPGMPKIVVLGGGTSHSVFFNEVNAAAGNATAMQAAIDSALFTGISETHSVFNDIALSPNPAIGVTLLNVSLNQTTEVNIEIVDQLGRVVSAVFSGTMQPGEHAVPVSVAELSSGIYFIRVSEATETRMVKLQVD